MMPLCMQAGALGQRQAPRLVSGPNCSKIRCLNCHPAAASRWHEACDEGSNDPCALERLMKRRDFLKSVSGLAAGAMVPAPAIWSAAKADARSETLLIVSEGGPNNLDIHGIGTNVPGYEVSWNC